MVMRSIAPPPLLAVLTLDVMSSAAIGSNTARLNVPAISCSAYPVKTVPAGAANEYLNPAAAIDVNGAMSSSQYVLFVSTAICRSGSFAGVVVLIRVVGDGLTAHFVLTRYSLTSAAPSTDGSVNIFIATGVTS